MTTWTNGKHGQSERSRELLKTLAAEVDRQGVIPLGGEFLGGSGFEDEIPELDLGTEGGSNA
jgi:hypothetical protein